MTDISIIAFIAGGLLYMVYGGIYYSVLLSDKKSKNESFSQQETKGAIKYVFAVLIAFISSFIVALFVQMSGEVGVLSGAGIGLLIGTVITMVYLKNHLFGLMSKKAFIIAIGDHLVVFTLLGILHGLI
ncbi:DUF1761 domain-containing protein [Guptibacillus algicola]|uniref:DUF1761 domain-containing protein n=1 Tax=Guptibacillus algicola TaxID=225844 RepID=UPI001CD75FD1|nr:DUF1761 domain-containing protein [Alkalihalobacillus algicola]MCA0986781.1 DUF1761 domain-containing protein [Alkalihalobacillus algicola]